MNTMRSVVSRRYGGIAMQRSVRAPKKKTTRLNESASPHAPEIHSGMRVIRGRHGSVRRRRDDGTEEGNDMFRASVVMIQSVMLT